ncbi:hypothetical protein Tco_1007178 [Tanacetum coccineum]
MEDVNPSSPPESPNSFRNRKVREINALLESLNLTAPPFECDLSGLEGDVKFVELFKEYEIGDFKEDDDVLEEKELGVEYFDKFPSRNELAYHKCLLCDPIPPLFRRHPIIVGGIPSNLKIPCNIGHVHVWKAYIDLNSPINIMTHMQYNWIMKRQQEPMDDPESLRGISNFTRRVSGMHIFIGNFMYVSDFLIIEDVTSVIDPCLSQVVLGKPFVELSNMTYDSSLRIVKFTNGVDKIAYMMPIR